MKKMKELYFFSKIFDKEFSNKIIDEPNKYFREKYNIEDKNKFTKNSYIDLYMKNGGINEKIVFEFITILLIMGIVHMPRLVNYWSNDPILNINYIPNIMSKNCFKMIASALHLSIDEEKPLDYEYDLSNEKKDEVDGERNDILNDPREKINSFLILYKIVKNTIY